MSRNVLLLLVLPLALAVGLTAAGCGTRAKGPVEITIWEQMDPPERAQLVKHLAQYTARHPGIRIVHQNYETETLRTQFQTAANAGAGPELVFGPSDQIGPFSAMGLIMPLEDVLGREYFAQLVPGSLDTLDGHLYYAPDQLGNHLVLIYNRKLVDHAPATSDELVAMARKLTVDRDHDGTPDQYGMVLNMVEPFWLVPFLTGEGGWVMDRANRPTLDTPAMANALSFLSDLRTRYKVTPSECNYQVMETLFKEGKAAFLVNGPWSWTGYRQAGIQFGIAPLPRMSSTGLWCAPMTASKGYSLNKNLKPELKAPALELLRFLTSPEVEADNARVLGTLPSGARAYDDPSVRDDATLKASRDAYGLGRRMPVVPEMRAIWDAMRPHMEKVLGGVERPQAAAAAMQADAIKQIRTMKE